jgi:uncharacterized repeat protein (TIGR01451 family)
MNTQLLKRMVLALVLGSALSVPMWSIAATVTFTSSGSWTVPAGVTTVTVEAWGGGGAGGGQNQNSDGGGGGGGGAYAKSTGVAVTPGSSIAITVGAGGVAASGGTGGTGGDSSFINSSTVMAKGGAGGAPSTGSPPAGGAGGSAVDSVGTTKFAGGNGGQGLDNNAGQGGPGGSSAGTAAAGTAGPTPWSTITASAAPAGGGIGGNGGTQNNNGSAPVSGNGGGGGGSGEGSPRSGGNGAAGKVIITYVALPTVTTNPATLVSALGATLNGTVTSDSASTTVVFEYGLTTAYGTTVTATQSPVAANAASVAVSAAITGLAAGTTYHYRVKGTNSTGTANGVDATFTTLPALSKVASAASASVGDVITFTITLSNSTATAFASKTVTDTLPAGMSYGSHVVSGGSVAVAGQVVTWTTPVLPANSSATMTLAVTLSQQGTLINSVESTGFTTASASVLVLANAVTHFRMDGPAGSWTGAAGEVLDSGGTALHGRRITTTSPTTTNEIVPAATIASQFSSVVGGFCNAASFDGNAVVQVASSAQFSYTTTLSASAWIYPTSYSSDLSSILSNDQNYEFHLNSTGKLYWWWGGPSLTSAATIPLNQWTHVAITFDSSASGGRQRIYINGVQDANTNNWKGTLSSNPCNFYIGGDVATGSCAVLTARNFRGNIDEVKLYTKELSASEVQADMTLGRTCSGTYDHIQIEHDGAASICTPETVTVKACLNANCSTLYTGSVTVQLSPAGWVGGNTFTFSGGIGSRQLSNGTAGNVTLGTVSASPLPASATKCFNGASETCTMNFANASCTFDAVETGAAPQTRLFTKLASTAFSVDVLALSSSTTINTGYTGAVDVDLVDTSGATCPSGTGLNTATSITFAGADGGRKPISLTYNAAAPNVRVRMRVGASAPACSTDNFAIRPAAAQLNTTALATPPSKTASPSFKAGAGFDLSATTNVGTSYGGTWTLDSTKLTAQTTTQDATQQTGGVVGTLTPSSLVANAGVANATYSEVGYVYLAPGAYIDSSFTAVDRANGDCITSTTGGANLSDVLSGGKYGCDIGNRSAVSLGRFYPDHFTITAPAVTPFCAASAPAVPFTYFGQDGFATAFTMTAQNSTNGTTQNYRGVFAKFVPTTYANYGFSSSALPAGAALLASATAPTGAWVDGVAAVTARHQISRPTNASADVLVTVNAAPTDGEASASATAAGSNVRLRYGRLRMQNAYGSELLALPMSLEAQFWNGTFYTTNTDDSCTALPMDSIEMKNFTGNLQACETQITPTGAQMLVSGRIPGGLVLTRPGKDATGVSNSGSVDLAINVTALAAGSTCVGPASSAATAANLPWFGPNIGGRATFGIYRSPLIYLRENY